MRECAFCSQPAKLTAEHITSEWMGKAFPGRKAFRSMNHIGEQREWIEPGLDLKVKVVCEPCNTGWMSDIEDKYGKPDLLPLMMGYKDAKFSRKEARSLAIWSYLKAIVLDCAQRHREPFFSRRLRHAFHKDLFIPQNVGMWMAVYLPYRDRRRFDYRVSLYKGEPASGYELQLYMCSFGFGALAFQVIAHRQLFIRDFRPLSGFERLAVPFWPIFPDNYIWPGNGYIKSFEHFMEFHERWGQPAPL